MSSSILIQLLYIVLFLSSFLFAALVANKGLISTGYWPSKER